MVLLLIAWCGLFMTKCDKYYFAYGSLPSQYQTQRTFLLFLCFEIIFFVQYAPMVAVIIFMTNHLYLFCCSFWLRQACVKWPASKETLFKETSPSRLETGLSTFQCLQILNIMYNKCFATVVIPQYKCLCLGSAITASFAAIKYGHLVSPFMLVMLLGICLIATVQVVAISVLGSMFFECSSKFRFSWVNDIVACKNPERAYFRRKLLSCHPFGFQVGSFYYVKKITILTVVNLIFNATLCLLIA
ncbi:unnamed protein product [Allacma fusca]|uniref:Uncharacterized protein n=1 Tax=Allacma fusca TaxID=39272 RepID=A0A8J2PEL0_9HEXA|nr:unnamed protein product [Allacma fusca]